MKLPLSEEKDGTPVRVLLTRDSVCAGDDCESHDRSIATPRLSDPVDFARAVSTGYLPSVAGIGHTWTCELNGRKIAEIGVSSVRPLVDALTFADANTVHFIYHPATY